MEVKDIVFEPYESSPVSFSQLYDFQRFLGRGAFGDVYEVVRKSSGTRMAIKVSYRFLVLFNNQIDHWCH